MNDFPYEDAAMPYNPDEETNTASGASGLEYVKRNHEGQLMSIEGVEGVGIGQNEIGDAAIIVYLRSEDVKKRLPRTIEGHPVVTHITGPIDAL
jgi:hypothetical protein